MSVDIEDIKALRERTGCGIMDCKRALMQSGGDAEKAVEILRRQGLARAREIQRRETGDGAVSCYVHFGDKLGVMVEVACETDFVARNEVFRQLAEEAAMQVAALAPQYISPEEIPDEEKKTQLDAYRQEAVAEGKPENVVERIAEGRLQKRNKEICLLEQPSIRDEKIPFKEVVAGTAARLGENVRIVRFVRFRVGEASQIAHAS
jgi:elongation factor Ts